MYMFAVHKQHNQLFYTHYMYLSSSFACFSVSWCVAIRDWTLWLKCIAQQIKYRIAGNFIGEKISHKRLLGL